MALRALAQSIKDGTKPFPSVLTGIFCGCVGTWNEILFAQAL
jgi:hypothetical protein